MTRYTCVRVYMCAYVCVSRAHAFARKLICVLVRGFECFYVCICEFLYATEIMCVFVCVCVCVW